jgi:NADH-quinone oxidoreductase subunit A
MKVYIPILGLALLAALFAFGSVAVSSMIGPKRYNRAKLDSYECGIQPTPQPVGGGNVPV